MNDKEWKKVVSFAEKMEKQLHKEGVRKDIIYENGDLPDIINLCGIMKSDNGYLFQLYYDSCGNDLFENVIDKNTPYKNAKKFCSNWYFNKMTTKKVKIKGPK